MQLFNRLQFVASALLVIALQGCGSSTVQPEINFPVNPPGTYTHTSDSVYLFTVEVNGKWGYIDTLGHMIIEPQYEDAANFHEGLASVVTESGNGYIDHNNKIVIPCNYWAASDFHDGWAFIIKEDDNIFIDKNNVPMQTVRITGGYDFDDGYSVVSNDDKYGVIDTTGAVIIDLKYDYIGIYHGCCEADLNGNEVLLDMQGNEMIPYGYKGFYWYGDPLVEAWGDEGTTIVDVRKNGKVIVPPIYDDVLVFEEEKLIVAEMDTMIHLLSLEGDQIFQPVNDWFLVDTTSIRVEIGGKWGLIDFKGKVLVPLKYDFAGPLVDGIATVVQDNKAGMIDRQGNVVVPLMYDRIGMLSEGLAPCELFGKVGYIDATGEMKIPLQFAEAGEFHEGLAFVQRTETGQYGYINEQGELAIDCKFVDAFDFMEGGIGFAESEEGLGMIDKKGNWLIQPKYDDIEEDDDNPGWFLLEKNNLYGIGTPSKGEIISPYFEDVYKRGNVLELAAGSNTGLADLDGNILLAPIFYEIDDPFKTMRKFTYRVRRGPNTGDHWGYLNAQGKIVWFSGDYELIKQQL